MATKKQSKFTPHRVDRRVICALFASLGVAASSPAWAQAEEEAEAVTLEPVTVTGARYIRDVSVGGKEPVKPREIPQSVSVITRERIEDQGLVTVDEALRQVTGVSVLANDTQASQYSSRGWGMNVTFDGVPAYSALSGVQQLDLALYEQIEVLRGSAGLFQGSGNPGGVVNLVRKRGQKERAFSASVSAGSWNNYNLQADVGGPLNASGSVRGRVVASITDREYFYDTTDTRKRLGYAALDWDITPATTLSVAFASQSDKTRALFTGLPSYANPDNRHLGVSRSTNLNPDWGTARWDIQDTLAELTHRFDNGWRVTAKLSQREQGWDAHYANPGSGVNPAANTLNYTRAAYDATYRRDGFDLYASGPFHLFGREHRATVGYNRERLRYANKRVVAPSATGIPLGHPDLVPDFDLPYSLKMEEDYRQSGYYGQLRLRLADPLTVIAGARVSDYDGRYRDTPLPAGPTGDWESGGEEHGEVTPYAGVIFDVNRQVSLYTSYSDIFAPQTAQKYGGGTVQPRVGKQYEIGGKGEFFDGNLIASIAFFKLRDKNRAILDNDHSGGGVYYYYDAGEVESKGWEIEVSGSPAPGWNIQTGWSRQQTTYLKNSATTDGTLLNPINPEHLFKLWSTYRFSGGSLDGLTIGLGANHSSRIQQNNTPAAATRAQKAYTIAHAFLSYRIDKNLTLSLNVNNLFDKTYYARVGSVSNFNLYGEPRNFLLTLRAAY
ncbi:MAG: TonB-dependent siderophore receptor [Zoogloeaceae bacterium]|jgi:outer membrane receptor for ferric coprogen and ferric-rhodotorulic acid|nr:TonB-dependent siderophore receptor [Zoogloeaceae bacterium]